MLLANFNRKEHLRHRAVSLRQHGFLVDVGDWLCDCRYSDRRIRSPYVQRVGKMAGRQMDQLHAVFYDDVTASCRR